MTDAAFAPSTEEGRIVDALRADAAAWIPDLSLVAVDETVGGAGSSATVVTSDRARSTADDGTTASPILGLGPISVAPDRQGQGIGGALIRETIERATAAGWPVIVLLGHATYYPRFGFESGRAPSASSHQQPWSDEPLDGAPAAGLDRRPARDDALPGGLRHRLTSMVRATAVRDDARFAITDARRGPMP